MPSDRKSLEALQGILSEVELLIATTDPLPENRTACALDLLRTGQALTNDMLKQLRMPAAVALGRKGGSVTSKRHGVEHYRKMADARKTHGGGRPRKQAE
jgi:hypothetical protein